MVKTRTTVSDTDQKSQNEVSRTTDANAVSTDDFKNLAERLNSIESSFGFVLAKVYGFEQKDNHIFMPFHVDRGCHI